MLRSGDVSNEAASSGPSLLTGVDGLRRCRMKSGPFWLVLDEAEALAGLLVLKWNSFGTVAERTIFSGGGSTMFGDSWESELKQRCVCVCLLSRAGSV